MATYQIMFRLEYDKDYSQRWSSVMEAIKAEAEDGVFWQEMTSVVVLKSSRLAEDLATSIYIYSSFNVMRDSLLVVNSTNNRFATRGQIDNPATLARLFDQGSNALMRGLG